MTPSVACFNLAIAMPMFSRGVPLLVVVALLLVFAGICAVEASRLAPHLEASETCCGFAQCSVLGVALLGFALWAVASYLNPATRFFVRSAS